MTLRPPDHVPSSLVAGKSWLAASLLALTGAAFAATPPAPPSATPVAPPAWLPEWQQMHESKTAAFDDFNACKFGLFIHWGLYAVPGGVWKGQRMEDGGVGPTVAEWVMRRKSIPR